MKICFLANPHSIHNKKLLSRLSKNHKIYVISFEKPTYTLPNVDFHYIKTNKKLLPLTFPLKTFKIRKLIDDINPDVIHAHYVLKYGVMAALVGKHPLITSAWGSDVLDDGTWKPPFYKSILKFCFNKTDKLHSVSEYLTKECMDLDVPEEKIVTVPIGVDTEKFSPSVDGSKIREELGWSDNPVVVSTRSFESVYNLELLIKAIPFIVKEKPETRFLLVGDGSLKKELIKLSKKLGVYDYIKFTGYMPNEKIPGYLNAADIYVSTSKSDSLGVSNLEAMSCGVFPILTDIAAAREWINHGENGFLVPLDKPEKLAEYILNAVENKNLRKKAAERNISLITEKAGLSQTISKLEEEYVCLTENFL